MRNDTGKVGAAFLIGGALGAAMALLYAPKSGRETRRDISRAAHRLKDSAADLIEGTIEDVNEFAGDLKEKAADILKEGADMSGRAGREIMATLERGQKAIEKQRRKMARALGI